MADTDIVQVIAEARIDARSLSEFVFKPANFMVTRRLAPSINTLEYYLNHFRNVEAEGNSAIARANNVISAAQASANTAINNIIIDGNAQISNAISNAGFVQVGTFATGATLDKRNDVIQASDGKLYRWGGSLPKTVTASSTPENSGGFGSNAWVEVSDASLAQKLAGLGGASTIGSGVSVFVNMAEFLAAESQIQDGSKVFLHSLYQGSDLEGEGRVYTYSKSTPKEVGLETGSGYLSRDFDGKVFIAEFGATGGDVSDRLSTDTDSQALQTAFDVIRANGGGELSMGLSCIYHLHGQIYANTSNLTWSVNNTTIVLGSVGICWEAIALGYTNYSDVLVTGGIWLGNTIISEGATAVSSIIFRMCKIDNMTIRDAKFVESARSHIMDIMGSRFVRFENNEVLGTPKDTAEYTEVLQLSSCTIQSYGIQPQPQNTAFFDSLPCSDVYCIGNKFIPYTNPTTGITSYPSRPIGDHIGPANIKNIYFEENTVEDVMLQPVSTIYLAEMMNIVAYNVSVKGNVFISKDGRNPYLMKLRWHTNKHSEIEEFTPWYVVEDNTFIVDNPDTSINRPLGNIYLEFIPYNSGYYGDNSKMGFDLKFRNNTFKGDQSNMPEGSTKVTSALYLDTSIPNYTVDISGNEFDLTGGYLHAIYQSKGTIGTRPKRDGGVLSITNNEFYGGLDNYTIHIQGTTTETSGKGQETRIEDNVFHNQWRMFRAYPRATVVYTGNKHYNWRLTDTNGAIGDNRAFRFDYIGDVIMYDNLVVIPKQKASYTTEGLPRDFTTGIQSWVGLDAEAFYIKESASYKMTYPDGSEPE